MIMGGECKFGRMECFYNLLIVWPVTLGRKVKTLKAISVQCSAEKIILMMLSLSQFVSLT